MIPLEVLPASIQLLVVFGIPWLCCSNLCLCLHTVTSDVSVPLNCNSYNPPVIEFKSHPGPVCLNLAISAKTYFQIKSQFQEPVVRTWTYFERPQLIPWQACLGTSPGVGNRAGTWPHALFISKGASKRHGISSPNTLGAGPVTTRYDSTSSYLAAGSTMRFSCPRMLEAFSVQKGKAGPTSRPSIPRLLAFLGASCSFSQEGCFHVGLGQSMVLE